MNYVPYTTVGGETWSYIANKAYGDPFNIKPIVDANPDIAISSVLEAGVTLRIPTQTPEDNTTISALLPFWKQ